MEKEEKKRMKYVSPTVEVMNFEPGNILAGSVGASSGEWNIDDSGTSAPAKGWSGDAGSNETVASKSGWSTD